MTESVLSEDTIRVFRGIFEEILKDGIAGLATKDDVEAIKNKVKKLKSSQNEAQYKLTQTIADLESQFKNSQNETQKLNQSIEDLERRFKARETFPTPPNITSPKPAQVVVQNSVSKPKWRNRSIYG